MRTTINPERVTLKTEYSRHYPDPLNKAANGEPLNIEHHILVSRAIDVPAGISKAPNPRVQNTDLQLYREVRTSLDNADDLTFHLKNKGITLLARNVDYSEDKKTVELYVGEGDGIVDGGHTYQIIREAQDAGTCPDGQYVKFEVLVGVPNYMAPDICGGLNTAMQVDDASLMNLEGQFDWVKEILKNTSFGSRITYRQNEQGAYDIREILGLMTLFNVNKFKYPLHPKDAYVSKAKCLDLYREDRKSFEMLAPILVDILVLHDYVHLRGRDRYNEAAGGRAKGMKGVYASRKRGVYEYVFTGKEAEYRLYDGTLYPMLGALRFLVEQKSGEQVYSWKLASFEDVKAFFDEVAPELVKTTYQTSLIYGRKPNPVGKDDNHWDNMYKTVALHYLSKYASR